MLRFIICDDEKEAQESVSLAIAKVMMPYDYDYRISKFTGYDEELQEVIKDDKDEKVYLLDVEMPKVSGLEIASEIRESGDWKSMILFVSAHPECKDDIFHQRLMAIDFISKYYQYEKRLEESLNKVMDIYSSENALTFNYDYITYRIPISKIIYIEKATGDKKCIIMTESKKKYEITSTLKELKKKLPKEFYQTHKACIVNTKRIEYVDYVENIIKFYNEEITKLLSSRSKKGLRKYVESN